MRRHFSVTSSRTFVGKWRRSGGGGGVAKEEESRAAAAAAGWWVPDPRTGIYFPRGQEWVMEDVPEDAASLGRSFWLRSVDGVEKPDPDHADANLSAAT
ncbi:unnamed protein product [Linum tenue]|uniref:Late embryogenesis abundant protein n=2 Tax=Linum tenue TaxID=586396 RepID=A0AAV0PNN5_9ROSI|nr:unnamed protein product [Linum tenue]